ncbi:hypothetical protein DPMN_041340 [Dreissena polymorpha]|uniref:Uncharacterized protein n=1 Tax=Dreissena polymorpha TaxID=45954 RepID=A0A9D4HW05_DREPO|nr:hypothetical protein DPMN_041340 [Dreissena polymorpha]
MGIMALYASSSSCSVWSGAVLSTINHWSGAVLSTINHTRFRGSLVRSCAVHYKSHKVSWQSGQELCCPL